MFGPMQVTKLFELSKLETVDEAVAKLLEFAEYPKIFRWFQFPSALVVFIAHADSLDSGAVYVYDRKQCVWLWVDFNDQNYGGYSPSEFDVLINQCHFFRLAASCAKAGAVKAVIAASASQRRKYIGAIGISGS